MGLLGCQAPGFRVVQPEAAPVDPVEVSVDPAEVPADPAEVPVRRHLCGGCRPRDEARAQKPALLRTGRSTASEQEVLVGACHDPSALSERRGRRGGAVHRLHNEKSVAPRESTGPANIDDVDYLLPVADPPEMMSRSDGEASSPRNVWRSSRPFVPT